MRSAWILSAALAGGFIVALALHGERPDRSAVKFVPAGYMAQVAASDVIAVEVLADGRRWRFARGTDGRWSAPVAPAPLAPDFAARLEQALALLRNTSAERVIASAELAGRPLADFGLEPPKLSIVVRSGASAVFTAAFGNANPIGLARYAAIGGQDGVALLPAYVAQAWEKALETPP